MRRSEFARDPTRVTSTYLVFCNRHFEVALSLEPLHLGGSYPLHLGGPYLMPLHLGGPILESLHLGDSSPLHLGGPYPVPLLRWPYPECLPGGILNAS